MADWSTIIPLAVQIPFVLLMAFILDRQAKLGVEVFKYLMAEFKTTNEKQADRHKESTETLLSLIEKQADRHRQVTDSLLGLIDDLASRQNPDKITHRQYKEFHDHLAEQVRR